MRIYVGTYHKYNSGNLGGAWLDLSDYEDKETFLKACSELHKDEADPEFMFQDFEDIPRSMIGESWVSDEAFEMAQMTEEDRELWMVYREGVDQDGSFDDAKDAFQGTYDSPEDYAYDLYDQTGELDKVPDNLKNYIDWEGVARDLRLGGDVVYIVHEGQTWVFSNH